MSEMVVLTVVLGMIILAATALWCYLVKTTPTLEDSMAVSRDVPARKGIADELDQEAQAPTTGNPVDAAGTPSPDLLGRISAVPGHHEHLCQHRGEHGCPCQREGGAQATE